MNLPMFPKPSQIKKAPEAVRVFRDNREVCNLLCKSGRDEYERRKRLMWERQLKTCILCSQPLAWKDTTFEHQDGRGFGGGHRNDAVTKNGAPYNGVSHGWCNAKRGSKRTWVDTP